MRILHSLASAAFPRVCHVCGASLGISERFICLGCLSKMPRTLYHRQPGNPMELRFAGLFPFERASGHFFYSRGSELAGLMADLKYRRFRGLARRLGEILGEELRITPFLSGIEYVVPVPMHFIKKATRGYNQAEEIARGFADAAQLPICTDLRAVRPHRTQTALSLQQRRSNTSGIFSLSPDSRLDGKSLLLLDDVCTTGSTLTSAAEAILAKAPEARISLLTLGVTF